MPLPPPFSIYQNPAKDQALTALPPVAALLLINFLSRPLDLTVYSSHCV
jgi:hypothetical protein